MIGCKDFYSKWLVVVLNLLLELLFFLPNIHSLGCIQQYQPVFGKGSGTLDLANEDVPNASNNTR
jgi:hypothetical protein